MHGPTRLCKKCSGPIPICVTINGNKRRLTNRTHCLICVPYGTSNYSILNKDQETTSWYYRKKQEAGINPILARCIECKTFIVSLVGCGCQFCGYNKCLRNISFHHIGNKIYGLSIREFQLKAETIIKELLKCAVACHNCHGEIHGNVIDHAAVIKANMILSEALAPFIGMTWEQILRTNCGLPINKPSRDRICFCGTVFTPNKISSKYCSRKCSAIAQIRIHWPDNLPELVKNSSQRTVAVLLGVSDKAVEKRLKNHYSQ